MANGLQPLRRPDDRLRPLNYPSLVSQPLRPLRQPQISPMQLEQPPSPTMGYLPGRQSVGEAVRDYPYQSFESLLDAGEIPAPEPVPLKQPEVAPQSLLDSMLDKVRDAAGAAKNLLDYMPSIISETGGADNPLPYVEGYTPDTFLDNWQKYYWAGEGVGKAPKKKEWLEDAKDSMARNTVFPSKVSTEVSDAIDKAVDIFGGDFGKDKSRRYSADRLRNDLVNTGWVESDYEHLKNLKGGSDSGYWQMQPKTAWDLLRSAEPHFYDPDKTTKFEKEFGSYHDLLKLSEDELKKKLRKKDQQDFAAALAAVKIITTFDY